MSLEQADPNISPESEPDGIVQRLSPEAIGSYIVDAARSFPVDSECRRQIETLVKNTPGGKAYEIAKNALFGRD